MPDVPAAFAVTCTGLGYAYLAAGLAQPFEVIQTLAQTGWAADKGKLAEGSARESEVARVIRQLWKQGPSSLWQGHQTATLLFFATRAVPAVTTFVISRLAVRPLLKLLPRGASRSIYSSPWLAFLLLLDSAAFTSFLLAPLSRKLTKEIFALGRPTKAAPAATVTSAAESAPAVGEDKPIGARIRAWLKKAGKFQENDLLTLPLMAETVFPLAVDFFAGSTLSFVGLTGGAKRQLSLVAVRLASLSVLTPLKLIRRRLQLVEYADEEPDAVFYQTVDGVEVEVFPATQDKKLNRRRVWDKTLAGVVGPEPLTFSWERLRPLYAGWEIDVARVLLSAAGSWAGWRWATAVERKRAREIKLSWSW